MSRSVFFHLIGVTRQSVGERLSAHATPNGPGGVNGHNAWCLPRDSSARALYLWFYDDLLTEAEPVELEALRDSLGMMPSVTVMVDVYGGVPGGMEVREFAAFILSEFRGVAWDDYTDHCWTLSEIQSGAQVEGRTFFEYDSWYHAGHNRPAP